MRLSRITSEAGTLTKTLKLAGGKIEKATAACLTGGQVETLTLDAFDEFAEVLLGLRHDQALTYGICTRGSGRLMSEKRWEESGRPSDASPRNRESFVWPNGPGILMLDYDAPPSGNAIKTGEVLRNSLYAAVPELEEAAHLWWPSATSCIWNGDSQLVGVRGQRVYVYVSEAAEIPRVGKLIAERLWLAGAGRIEVSKAGSLLERTLIDTAVWQPERLDFAAGALCEPPLEQRRGAPERFGRDDPLNSRALFDLSNGERERVERGKKAARHEAKPRAEAVKREWIAERGKELCEHRGIEKSAAERIAHTAVERQRLLGDFVLVARDGQRVTVAEVLDNRETWDGARFRDPLEPDYPDERIAWLNLTSGLRPYLYSHAHGGCRYDLSKAQVTVEIAAGGTGEATDAVLRVMQEDGSYFERGSIVTVSERGDVVQLGLYALKHGLERAIRFEKWDGRKEALRPVDCPDEIARRILDLRGAGGLRKLSGVICRPTMTPAGRLIEQPGYDEETRLLLVNASDEAWPSIPRDPSMSQVQAALEFLWSPVSQFPFVDDASRGVCLAAMLTAVSRRALPTAPAFMFAAPAAGSGKTLLGNCVVALAGGGAALTLPDTDAETAKTLLAALRRGSPAIFFDNVTGAIDRTSLNAVLTSEEYDGRILGVSEMTGALPTNALVVLTGNNARPAGDACRRMLVCSIDPRTETPYLRKFDFDPLEVLRSQPMDYVVAALTVLQAFVKAGRPAAGNGSLASFEAWDRLIRQAVVWVGQLEGSNRVGFADPIARIQDQFAADEDTEALRSLLEAWDQAQDGVGFRAAELFRLLDSARRWDVQGADPQAALGAALVAVMPKALTPKGVGKWLKGVQGRIAGGRRLVGDRDAAANSMVWRVQRV